jgi:hypothetical protein
VGDGVGVAEGSVPVGVAGAVGVEGWEVEVVAVVDVAGVDVCGVDAAVQELGVVAGVDGMVGLARVGLARVGQLTNGQLQVTAGHALVRETVTVVVVVWKTRLLKVLITMLVEVAKVVWVRVMLVVWEITEVTVLMIEDTSVI